MNKRILIHMSILINKRLEAIQNKKQITKILERCVYTFWRYNYLKESTKPQYYCVILKVERNTLKVKIYKVT